MSQHTLKLLNQSDKEQFVDVLGSVYENSSWVASRAWSEHPFESVSDLVETMEATVENATHNKQLQLLRAHPDLGENTEMTDASEKEQASAGLDQLSPKLYERFQELNAQYQERFEFPFIMSVKDESPRVIKERMEERLENSQSEEFRTALDEVHTIARLRIEELVSE